MKKRLIYFFTAGFIFLGINAQAKGTYLEPEQFLINTFGTPPKPKKLWIKKDLKPEIKKIMGHDLGVIRIKYWDDADKTAWILEEIGRDKPITVGLVVKDKKIEKVNVLIFRESRGWEVKYPFFTYQYKQVSLLPGYKLNKKIDDISGATLSGNALNKLARLALYLDS
ncbi:MAG: FMN-binding protein, partial [Proteobacteria bacterium]|nr:FMN-binding protein [Pseudomonadota bacterium]